MSETLGLKNVNLLTKEQYNGITEPATDELYAISGSGFGFPSSRYVDLTLGASGTIYKAPANGYYVLKKTTGATDTYMLLVNHATGIASVATSYNTTLQTFVFCPAKKGEGVQANYNFTGATHYFRFIYAEGEE